MNIGSRSISFIFIIFITCFCIDSFAGKIDEKKVNDLINDLSSTSFSTSKKASDKLVGMGKDVVPLLLEHTKKDDLILPDLVEILGIIGDPTGVPILAKLAKHKKYIVRVRAIRALGEIGNKEAMGVLLNLYSDPKSSDEDVYTAIVSCSNKDSVSILINAAENDTPIDAGGGNVYRVSTPAIEALGNMHEKSAVPILRKKLEKSKNVGVRRNAVESLLKIDPNNSTEMLKHLEKNDPEESIRELARENLKQIENKNKKGN